MENEKGRMTVNETERTMVEQARCCAKAEMLVMRKKGELKDAEAALATEKAALARMVEQIGLVVVG